ncbi:hypothetical protein ACFYP4_02880 [Streptomyces sp. NPDC005551]|uniref:hypothetical protein n=1 Tax=Streptomyces sp. NPDC005551 TaxID=3364725 RepID=UPI0036755620
MTKRAIKNTKRIDDRRRSGVGDNSPFTARTGVSGLGAGKRVSSLVGPSMAKHQYTNRGARNSQNGKGKKTI